MKQDKSIRSGNPKPRPDEGHSWPLIAALGLLLLVLIAMAQPAADASNSAFPATAHEILSRAAPSGPVYGIDLRPDAQFPGPALIIPGEGRPWFVRLMIVLLLVVILLIVV